MKLNKILKNWKFWIVCVIVIIVILLVCVSILRNNLTAEETVSKFMYLIENKEYEKAKKLSDGKLEHLELLSNIKPSNLSFEFSKDKKEATAILLEDEIESTDLNITLKNTLLGWKIKNYEVITDLIEPQTIEDRLKEGTTVSDIQLLYWAESEVANKEEIEQYANDNGMIALIFIESMKDKNYDKANELYQPILETDLTVEQLKEYDWNNYKIESNFELIDNLNSIIINVDNKKLGIIVAGKGIVNISQQ